MQSGFAKGMLVGGLIAASISMIANSDRMDTHARRRMMKNGRTLLRKSGNIIGEVIDIFR